MFNNIWSSACLCLEVSGLVLACVQQYCRMAGLVLACVQQYCIFISIWSCSGLCSTISGLKYLVYCWFEFSNTIRSSVFSSIVR